MKKAKKGKTVNVENQNPEHDPQPNKLGYNFLKLEKESATKRPLARAECRLFSGASDRCKNFVL